MKNFWKKTSLGVIVFAMLLLVACQGADPHDNSKSGAGSSEKKKVVFTTTMLYDLGKILAKDKLTVEGLMGPGVDPHLYQPSAGDVQKVQSADMLVYNGLHLEGKMGEVFESVGKGGTMIVNASKDIPKRLILPWNQGETKSDQGDPHIWFDVKNWMKVTETVAHGLGELDPSNKDFYEANAKVYLEELKKLDQWSKDEVATIPKESRYLITAHDAFNYFSRAYDIEVKAIQGVSTETEAGAGEMDKLASFIAQHKVKAIFVESSVPKKNVEALKEAVRAKGFDVKIGGELYSDSIGDAHSDGSTYLDMVKHNVRTMVSALK